MAVRFVLFDDHVIDGEFTVAIEALDLLDAVHAPFMDTTEKRVMCRPGIRVYRHRDLTKTFLSIDE